MTLREGFPDDTTKGYQREDSTEPAQGYSETGQRKEYASSPQGDSK